MQFRSIPVRSVGIATSTFILGFVFQPLFASENVPHAPFAQWADVPAKNTLVARLTYQESEAYYFWAGNTRYKVDFEKGGEHYGIDVNQGYLSLDYGITEKWAADLSVGYTTSGWRFFANGETPGTARSTTGLMDISFGFRYQIFNEAMMSNWVPTLTFRAGAVLPGSFNEKFPFSPGLSSTAIEPELLARKHFGWPGLGAYFDGLFRWNHTSANDQYIVAVGLFQKIQRWELDMGYRHLGSINGDNIEYDPVTQDIIYPRAPRENQDAFEAGFSYTTRKGLKLGFQSRTVFDGANTDKKFWLGGYIEFPFNFGK